MDDCRHITQDQYEEICCQIDDVIGRVQHVETEILKDNEIKSCADMILEILCLDKPE